MGDSSISSVVIARLAAAAAEEVPDVLGLHGGAVGEVATYGPNGPVRGIRVWRTPAPRLQLRLVVRFGVRLDQVAEAVRSRVAAVMAEQAPDFASATVDVHIADVHQPPVGEEQRVRELPSNSVAVTDTGRGTSAGQP